MHSFGYSPKQAGGRCLVVLAHMETGEGKALAAISDLTLVKCKCVRSTVECWRIPRQTILSQSLIDLKLSSHVSILKILANEKPEQLVAAFFCSAHLSPSSFSLAQEGSSCFLANRYFPFPTKLGRG